MPTSEAALTFDTPGDGAVVRDLSQLSGRRDATIIRVEVAVMRHPDSTYWNGTRWQAGTRWLLADLNAQGWSFDAGPSVQNLTHDSYYRVAVRGRRSQQSPVALSSWVRADLEGPKVTIFSLIPKSSVLSLRNIDGLTSGYYRLNGETDLASVELTIQRMRDGFFWTGRRWNRLSATDSQTRLPVRFYASPFTTFPVWTFANGPSQAAMTAGDYRVVVTARDKLGNSASSSVEVSSVIKKSPVLRGLIAFSAAESAYSNNSNIFVINADGSGQRQLTARQGSNINPQLSPDGKKIAFLSTRFGAQNSLDLELCVMKVDGSQARRLTDPPKNQSNNFGFFIFDWSPDSRHIVFEKTPDDASNFDIFLVSIAGGEPVNISRNISHDYAPAFTPNGRRIAFFSNRTEPASIHTMNLDGSDVRAAPSSISIYAPFRFSPDGRKIAYLNGLSSYAGPIKVADPYGRRPVLVSRNFQAFSCGWSPDGKRLVLSVEFKDPYESATNPYHTRAFLFTANLDGSDLRQLSETPLNFMRVLTWR